MTDRIRRAGDRFWTSGWPNRKPDRRRSIGCPRLKSPDFLENVSSAVGDEIILLATKPFSAFGAGIWKQRMVIKLKK
jgi:hypothetical protein